jgi:hypothetical protein
MCIHPKVADEGSRESVDARCRRLTATWVREQHMEAVAQEAAPATARAYHFRPLTIVHSLYINPQLSCLSLTTTEARPC